MEQSHYTSSCMHKLKQAMVWNGSRIRRQVQLMDHWHQESYDKCIQQSSPPMDNWVPRWIPSSYPKYQCFCQQCELVYQEETQWHQRTIPSLKPRKIYINGMECWDPQAVNLTLKMLLVWLQFRIWHKRKPNHQTLHPDNPQLHLINSDGT